MPPRPSQPNSTPGPSTSTSTRPSRKRKSLSPTYILPPLQQSRQDADAHPDPDFLALSKRQRKEIDEAFRQGLEMVREREIGGENGREDGGGGKRRKVDDGITDGSGGGGGFQAEDAALGGSGGFLPDDSDVNMDDDQTTGGGGFFTSDNDNDGPPPPLIKASSSKVFSRTTPAHLLPLSFLPSTMSLLSLAVDDDVLAVFESTGFQSIDSEMTGVYGHREFPAEGEGQGEEGFGVGEGIKGYTTLRDFRAVCAAMIEPEPESEFEGRDGQEMDTDEPMNGMDMDQDEDDEEDSQDAYKEDDTSSLSSLDSEGDEAAYNPNPSTAANNKSRRRQRNLPPIEDDLILPSQSQQPKKPRLSPEQKQNITRLWNLMFQNTPAGILAAQTGRGGERYLGKEQVRRWAEIMGEVWTEQEITDMIELFSSQPGKRGLSYDDFSTILIRGGLL